MRLLCPKRHLIDNVDVIDGKVIPRGVPRGLTWGHAAPQDITCVRAQCRRCKYDRSVDYRTLCAEVARAATRGDPEYRMTW